MVGGPRMVVVVVIVPDLKRICGTLTMQDTLPVEGSGGRRTVA